MWKSVNVLSNTDIVKSIFFCDDVRWRNILGTDMVPMTIDRAHSAQSLDFGQGKLHIQEKISWKITWNHHNTQKWVIKVLFAVNYVNNTTCKRLSNILKYLCLYNLFIFSFIVWFTVSENYLVDNKLHYPIRMNIN